MTETSPVVFVVDDDPSVRGAVSRFLKSVGFRVEAFASAEDFLKQPLPDLPACVVLDVCIPGLDGLDAQHTLAQRNASPPVVFITGHGDIPLSVRAMKAGAVDFLPKPFNNQDLLAAVRSALARHRLARQEATERSAIGRRVESLSPREREVMALVVSGMLNKQIGHRLGVSEKTIKVHRARVMAKMQADSLPDLVRMAEKVGVRAPIREAHLEQQVTLI
jgi:FixJ family two-component response regulator